MEHSELQKVYNLQIAKILSSSDPHLGHQEIFAAPQRRTAAFPKA
jgi:hypothetical protein